MQTPHATIHVESGSELDHLLESVSESEVLLVREGVRYRLNRVEELGGAHRVRTAPERVVDIIGLGNSAEVSNIASQKDAYIADAVDHRGT